MVAAVNHRYYNDPNINGNWSHVLVYVSIPSKKQLSVPRSRFSQAMKELKNFCISLWKEYGMVYLKYVSIKYHSIYFSSGNCEITCHQHNNEKNSSQSKNNQQVEVQVGTL